MSVKIYTYPQNPRVFKSLIAAEFLGVADKIEVVNVQIGVDNKTPEFLAKFPLGKVPVADTPQGPISDSAAILKYVAGLNNTVQLFGSNTFETALIEQWIGTITGEVEPHAIILALPHWNITKFDQAVYEASKAAIINLLAVFDAQFKKTTFITGNAITAADIIFACTFKFLFATVLNSQVQGQFPHVKRAYVTLANHPVFKKVLGEPVIAVDEKPAPGQKIVKPKVAAAAKVVVEKKKNPLDLLPPSEMRLDDVKRSFFLSRPYNPEFFPAFWDSVLDKSGYSVWKMTYLYPEDFEKDYVADNLICGFINRCEAVRKYAFGVLNVIGAEPTFECHGAIIFRGQDIIEEMKDVTDFDEYKFERLDIESEEGRKYFQTVMCDEEIFGKPVTSKRYIK